jgi:hypothetical protein
MQGGVFNQRGLGWLSKLVSRRVQFRHGAGALHQISSTDQSAPIAHKLIDESSHGQQPIAPQSGLIGSLLSKAHLHGMYGKNAASIRLFTSRSGQAPGMLSVEELEEKVDAGEIDTVVVGMTDMYGRMVGKRYDAGFFLESAVGDGTHACSYLLATDMDMETVPGYKVQCPASGNPVLSKWSYSALEKPGQMHHVCQH